MSTDILSPVLSDRLGSYSYCTMEKLEGTCIPGSLYTKKHKSTMCCTTYETIAMMLSATRSSWQSKDVPPSIIKCLRCLKISNTGPLKQFLKAVQIHAIPSARSKERDCWSPCLPNFYR